MTVKCKFLTYLDDRPVFPKDRACSEAWAAGGIEAEKIERQKWIDKDRREIQESVNYLARIRKNAEIKRQKLGLPPISDHPVLLSSEVQKEYEAETGLDLDVGGDVDVECRSTTGSEISGSVNLSDLETSNKDTDSEFHQDSDTGSVASLNLKKSTIKAENRKPVSKNIFVQDEINNISGIDDDTSDAYSTTTDTRSKTTNQSVSVSKRDSNPKLLKDSNRSLASSKNSLHTEFNTSQQITDLDSDVASQKSFSLDQLPSCHDDVSSIASEVGNKLMVVSDDENDPEDVLGSEKEDDVILPHQQNKTQINYNLNDLKSKDIFDESDFIISSSSSRNKVPEMKNKKVIPSLNPNPTRKSQPKKKMLIQEISDSESSDSDPDWESKPRIVELDDDVDISHKVKKSAKQSVMIEELD